MDHHAVEDGQEAQDLQVQPDQCDNQAGTPYAHERPPTSLMPCLMAAKSRLSEEAASDTRHTRQQARVHRPRRSPQPPPTPEQGGDETDEGDHR